MSVLKSVPITSADAVNFDLYRERERAGWQTQLDLVLRLRIRATTDSESVTNLQNYR